MNKLCQEGITLVELMIALAIIAILTSISLPHLGDFLARQKVRGATETVHTYLQFAKSEAIRNNKMIYVYFQKGTEWCLGLSESNRAEDCDCSTESKDNGNCSINNIAQKIIKAEDFKGINLSATPFFNNLNTSFNPHFGQTISGRFTLTMNSHTSTIIINNLGRVRTNHL